MLLCFSVQTGLIAASRRQRVGAIVNEAREETEAANASIGESFPSRIEMIASFFSSSRSQK